MTTMIEPEEYIDELSMGCFYEALAVLDIEPETLDDASLEPFLELWDEDERQFRDRPVF